jgi:hypothetical protein
MADDTKPSTNGGNGRDARGRFSTGNAGGPGNPFARQVAVLRSELIMAVTPKDIRQIVQALLKKAKKGNLGAAKLLLAYSIGNPQVAVDPDTVDERELKNAAGYFRAECDMHRRKPSIVDRALWSVET